MLETRNSTTMRWPSAKPMKPMLPYVSGCADSESALGPMVATDGRRAKDSRNPGTALHSIVSSPVSSNHRPISGPRSGRSEDSTIRLWGKNNPGPVRQRAAVVDSLWDLWGMAWAGSEQRAARTAPFGVCVASPLQGNQHFPLPATNTRLAPNLKLASPNPSDHLAAHLPGSL
jgi:hypothetical protein